MSGVGGEGGLGEGGLGEGGLGFGLVAWIGGSGARRCMRAGRGGGERAGGRLKR